MSIEIVGQPRLNLTYLTMYDAPVSPYAWWHNGDETDPLLEFSMNLQFSTWIMARDITGGDGPMGPFNMKILHHWGVVLDRRYKFDVVKKTAPGPLTVDLTKTKCTVLNPSRQPFVTSGFQGLPLNAPAIFSGNIANDVFEDQVYDVGAKSVGEFVKSRAAMFGGT